MTATTFDTHAAVIVLRNAGIEERHAEAIVNTVRESANADRGELAAKGDLADLRADLAGVEGRLRADTADLRAEVAGVETRLYRALWIQGGVLLATQVAIAGFIVSMVGQMLGTGGQ